MTQLIGRFVITKRLSFGGLAEVYLAQDPQTSHQVAIKKMHYHMATNHQAAQEYHQEIEALRQFDHPNVVRFCGQGEEDGVPYFVMEYLPGGNLEDKMQVAGGVITVQDSENYLFPILDALSHVHDRGYVHGDLKAAAILFEAQDRPILTDFSTVKTTIQACTVDDLHALGTVLYYCLTGKIPFAYSRILPPALDKVTATVSSELGDIVMKLLSKDMAGFPDAASLKQRLQEALNTQATQVTLWRSFLDWLHNLQAWRVS